MTTGRGGRAGPGAKRQALSRGSPGANFANRTLFQGDNLEFMRGMNSGSVDLIATDPPFNKGRDFHATPDSLAKGASFQDRWSWERDVHEEWTDQIRDDYPKLMEAIESARHAHSDGLGAFMCFMAVRLIEMHRILKETGSIYLHCDPTASHYLKAVMDAIFGWKQFRNEIVWQRTSAHNDAGAFGRVHDRVLFYGEGIGRDGARVPLDEEHVDKKYRRADDRGRYRLSDLTGPKTSDGESGKPWRGWDPTDSGRCWSVPRTGDYARWIDAEAIPGYLKEESVLARLDMLDKAGMIHFTSTGTPRLKGYLAAHPGQVPPDVWTDIPPVNSQAKERTGYPTQKPLALYERIIRASSNEGDMVFDPFCGCATTLVAAETLQRQWAGADIWGGAHKIVMDRLRDTTGLLGKVTLETTPPARTDDGEEAAPFMLTPEKVHRRKEPWQRLSRAEIVAELADAQKAPDGLITCAGCGRKLEAPFMELDHITPRADRGENDISNRILLCRPCNGRKNANLTMRGLTRENKKAGWMQDEAKAKRARELAERRYHELRDGIRQPGADALL